MLVSLSSPVTESRRKLRFRVNLHNRRLACVPFPSSFRAIVHSRSFTRRFCVRELRSKRASSGRARDCGRRQLRNPEISVTVRAPRERPTACTSRNRSRSFRIPVVVVPAPYTGHAHSHTNRFHRLVYSPIDRSALAIDHRVRELRINILRRPSTRGRCTAAYILYVYYTHVQVRAVLRQFLYRTFGQPQKVIPPNRLDFTDSSYSSTFPSYRLLL